MQNRSVRLSAVRIIKVNIKVRTPGHIILSDQHMAEISIYVHRSPYMSIDLRDISVRPIHGLSRTLTQLFREDEPTEPRGDTTLLSEDFNLHGGDLGGGTRSLGLLATCRSQGFTFWPSSIPDEWLVPTLTKMTHPFVTHHMNYYISRNSISKSFLTLN